ncbi:MAG: hypothetical protein K6E31_01755 [bacterium]|nr:hypothetical protein [bacterium]
MSSTVVVTGAALYSVESMAGASLLALFGPALVVDGLAAAAREAQKQRWRLVEQTWQQTSQMLRREIDQVRSVPERQNLTSLLNGMASVWRQAMMNNDAPATEKALAGLRQKIFSAQADEKMLDSRRDELSRLLTKLSAEAPSGFAPELEALRKDGNSKNSSLSIEEQTKRIEALKSKARKLAGEIAQANALSLDDLVEETVFIPEPVDNKQSKEDEDAAGVALVADICDFGGRIAFFDEREAERLKPLVLEAKQGTTMTRLKLIRGEIKTIYGHLRECAVLTDMFKRDLRDFLPPMRKAQGTEQLCRRMEELLEASNVSRDAYDKIYMSVKKVFLEQMETITDALLAEKVEGTLKQMGYTLMDEEGRPVELKAGEARLLSTPYEGYRVRVKVGQDGAIATRLVRVVGSEEEKTSVSEYQKQADIEVGKKWCANLKQIHEALAEEGLPVRDIFRKEPGEEPLDIIVDPSIRKPRKQAKGAERPQERLRERNRG